MVGVIYGSTIEVVMSIKRKVMQIIAVIVIMAVGWVIAGWLRWLITIF